MSSKLEQRVAALEGEVARLRASVESAPAKPWWEAIAGRFSNDPIFDEAMRLGRAYRESLRPKPGKAQRGRNVRPRH